MDISYNAASFEDPSKLSTSEVVKRFLTGIRPRAYAYEILQRVDADREIRSYVDRCGLSQISLLNCFYLLDFAENEVVCELLDDLLCAWASSFLHNDTKTRLATSGVTYLAEIAHTVSSEHKRRYGSYDPSGRGDWMLIERMQGMQHLSFFAKHLNKQFEDPGQIEQWNIVFRACFKERNGPQDAPIAALFCRSLLESEDDNPQIPFFTKECDELCFELSVPVLRFICINGLSAIKCELWSKDLHGKSEFRLTLHNIVRTIITYKFYQDFDERETIYFKDALVMYLRFGFPLEMCDFLKAADEDFIRLAIEAWSDALVRDEVGR